MAQQTLDEKITLITEEIDTLTRRNLKLGTDLPISWAAKIAAVNNGDAVGAELNYNAYVSMTQELAANTDRLKLLTKADGILAVLQQQKQIQIAAQNAIVENTLTAQQQSDIELAKIKAASEAAQAAAKNPAPKSNTTTYIIIGAVVVVVIAIAVFAYFKMKK